MSLNKESKELKSVDKENPWIDKKLLELLVCPIDKGDLLELKATSQLQCSICKKKYLVKDGIPIMLV